MSWSSLPNDLEHVILTNIGLIELARITTTCSSFRAAFWERMDPEQEARRQLAVNTFGADRIAGMLALFQRFLKRECLPPGFRDARWNWFWISADGLLHVPVSSASQIASKNGDMRVGVRRETHTPGFSLSDIDVKARSRIGFMLEMQILHERRFVSIKVIPTNDEDLVPVALVQALLSEGLARIMRDVGHHAKVHIGWDFMESGCTQAGMKAQIMPLLPFASQYTCAETMVGERMRIG